MTSPKASHRAFAADLFIAGKSILNEVLLQEKHSKKRRKAGKGQGEGEKMYGDHSPSILSLGGERKIKENVFHRTGQTG
jgi:hypothetical protein